MGAFDFSKVTFLQFGTSGFNPERAVKKSDKSKIQSEAKEDKLKHRKEIISSPELECVKNFYKATRDYIKNRSVSSFLGDGVYVVKNENVDKLEQFISQAKEQLPIFIDAFCEVYEEQKEEQKGSLGNLWREDDYPPVEEVRRCFAINHTWIATGVPESLPDATRQEQIKRQEQQWREQEEAINNALCLGFKEVIDHAVEMISGKSNGGRLHDSAIDNVKEFFKTFKDRDIFSNESLQKLVERAEAVLNGVDAGTIKADLKIKGGLAGYITGEFKEVSTAIGGMITDKPSRKIRF